MQLESPYTAEQRKARELRNKARHRALARLHWVYKDIFDIYYEEEKQKLVQENRRFK